MIIHTQKRISKTNILQLNIQIFKLLIYISKMLRKVSTQIQNQISYVIVKYDAPPEEIKNKTVQIKIQKKIMSNDYHFHQMPRKKR